MRRHRHSRPAFTLVEMMVSSAIILFLMAIIAAAFRSGLDTFSKLRVVGMQQEQLENTKRIFQRDLLADHFQAGSAGFQPGLQGPRLSEQRLDRVGWEPPTFGYFIAWQYDGARSPLADAEQRYNPAQTLYDGDGIASTRSAVCKLRFSVRLAGEAPPYDIPINRFAQEYNSPVVADRTTYASTIIDPVQFNYGSGRKYYFTSKWADVQYHMVATGTQTDGANPLPLYSLRRTAAILSDPSNPLYAPPSYYPNETVTTDGSPAPRVSRTRGNNSFTPINDPVGNDVLLTDVVSFELKYLWDGPADFGNWSAKKTVHPGVYTPALVNVPFTSPSPPVAMYVRNSQGVYDTPNPPLVNSPAVWPYSADWPFTDLPVCESRCTTPDGTGTRVNKVRDAWPGSSGAGRYWDNEPTHYFDTWYKVSDLGRPYEPTWTSYPLDDRGTKSVNPLATLPNQPPLRVRIKAIQFKLRIYDAKTRQTRQITFMQEV